MKFDNDLKIVRRVQFTKKKYDDLGTRCDSLHTVQGDQLYIAVCFWYLDICDIVYCTYTSHFLQGTRKKAMFNW